MNKINYKVENITVNLDYYTNSQNLKAFQNINSDNNYYSYSLIQNLSNVNICSCINAIINMNTETSNSNNFNIKIVPNNVLFNGQYLTYSFTLTGFFDNKINTATVYPYLSYNSSSQKIPPLKGFVIDIPFFGATYFQKTSNTVIEIYNVTNLTFTPIPNTPTISLLTNITATSLGSITYTTNNITKTWTYSNFGYSTLKSNTILNPDSSSITTNYITQNNFNFYYKFGPINIFYQALAGMVHSCFLCSSFNSQSNNPSPSIQNQATELYLNTNILLLNYYLGN